jgi:hypothetical protein
MAHLFLSFCSRLSCNNLFHAVCGQRLHKRSIILPFSPHSSITFQRDRPITDLRNNYAILFDMIHKNFAHIQNPRGSESGSHAMGMM